MKPKKINSLFEKWVTRLGLRWWNIKVVFYDDPSEIVTRFKEDDTTVCVAVTHSDWRYAEAKISVNLPAWKDVTKDEAETIVIHELVHVLVNEMRTSGNDHEERVVTNIVKAFRWTVEDVERQFLQEPNHDD